MDRFDRTFAAILFVLIVAVLVHGYFDGRSIVDMKFQVEHKTWQSIVSCEVDGQELVLLSNGNERRFSNPTLVGQIIDGSKCHIDSVYEIHLYPIDNDRTWESCPLSLDDWQGFNIGDVVIVTTTKVGDFACDTLVAQP